MIKKSGIYIKCKLCGKKAYRYPSQIDKYNKFCSRECWYKFMRGSNNPFWKKKHLEETIENNRIKHLGKKATKETREKIRKIAIKNAKYGNANNLWKGGISDVNNRIRQSSKFKIWRENVYERDSYTCQKCGNIGNRLNPHHIKNFADNPKIRFDVDNGITLCQKCHREFHRIYGRKDNNEKQLREYLKNN